MPRWLTILTLLFASACERTPTPIRVAAAADLSLAFEELGRAFEARTGRQVVFSFGATGLLATQLRQGAPFDLFAAANRSLAEDVVAAGACDGRTLTPYARGRLAVRPRTGVAPPAAFEELASERFARIAIANPEHAPYGQAAREALERAGILATVEPRLVLGANVRHALQLVETGNVDAAIVARSHVARDGARPWLPVDEAMHRPIDQTLVVCEHGAAREGGEAFARFVGSDSGRVILRRHGFLRAGEREAELP